MTLRPLLNAAVAILGLGCTPLVSDGLLVPEPGAATEQPQQQPGGSPGTGVGSGPLTKRLALGVFHSCMIAADDGVKCWGELASGNVKKQPTLVSPRVNATELAAGEFHDCAIDKGTGHVRCWGEDAFGALGGDPGHHGVSDLETPVGVRALAAGWATACAIDSAGALWCWGRNEFGELGNGLTQSSDGPVRASAIPGLVEPVSKVALGSFGACAIGDAGRVACWGDPNIAKAQLPTNAVAVDVSPNHACAVKSDGTAWCWGINVFGQLGDGTDHAHEVPVQVATITDAVDVVTGHDYACVLRQGGGVRCWGSNQSGGLGDGTQLDRSTPIAPTGLPADVVEVATGQGHTCVRTATGRVLCWGENYHGQVGDGTLGVRLIATEIVAASN